MTNQIEIHHSISSSNQKKWDSLLNDETPFLKSKFLKLFEVFNPNSLLPFYISFDSNLIYGNLITIEGKKTANYFDQDKKFSFKRWLLKRANVKFFCFGNTHLSNLASHHFLDNKISEHKLKELIYTIKRNYWVNYFLIPDHFLVSVDPNKKKLSSRFNIITIDPDMRLNISKDWKSFEDYKNNISSKYKKRLRRVFHLSNPLEIKPIKKEDIPTQLSQMEELYLNVYENSSFSGPPFNMNIFLEFFKNKDINHQISGYYLKNNLVAFSSEFFNGNKLYSYYIGLDYNVNRKYKIYNRILYDTISNGISKNATQIIFGRTASEFKSTVGAIPKKSKSAIFIVNPIINFLLSPILNRISPDDWIQRNPFK